jgi:hypothetical protein
MRANDRFEKRRRAAVVSSQPGGGKSNKTVEWDEFLQNSEGQKGVGQQGSSEPDARIK